jgi:hypothetical protein
MLLLSTLFVSTFAQKLTVQVSSNKVQVGVPFQIAFSINTVPNTFTPPDFKNFDIYSGPNQSQSTQFVNGNLSQSFSISYLLSAKKEGKLTIGAMTIVANGQSFQSNPVTVEAFKGNVPSGGQQQQQQAGGGQAQEEDPAYSTKVSGEELFIRTSVSKTKCYMGEQVLVTQKVYSRLDLRGFQNVKFPSYNGFWSQQQEGNQNIQLQIENLDGVNYYVGEFSRTYVFPQRSGKLTIDPTELECVVRKQTSKKPRNIFEQFFGSGGFEDVAVKAKSKPIVIDVTPLPEQNKPENFSGGVGNFSYKVEANKTTLKANNAFNLKVTVSGRGNIKLIDAPKLKLPESFETYDPKMHENISNNGAVSGSKVYDYLVIPRQPGEFTLDGLDFSYFDLDKKQYVTIPAQIIKITVNPGDASSNASAQVYDHLKQEIKETENDIRYIKKGDFKLAKADEEFFNSSAHFVLMSLSLLLFVGGLGYRSYYLKKNADVVAVRGRKAAKVAKKQLSVAEKKMKENNKEQFYTEVMSALNSYLVNKLNIPVAELSRENIVKGLNSKHINPGTQLKLFETLDQCEYAKYAPGAVSGDLQMVYGNTVELISSLEGQIKHA